MIKKKSKKESVETIETDIKKELKNDTLKKIYRDIAKKTHPDKIKDLDKNSTYIKATESYNKNDILDLIYYANQLGVEYSHNTLDLVKMRSNVNKIKSEIRMYESTLPYKWYYNDKDVTMLKNYIATQFLTS
jgi:hypothetical protein